MSQIIHVKVLFTARVDGSRWTAKLDDEFHMTARQYETLSFAEWLDERMRRAAEMAAEIDNADWAPPHLIGKRYEREGAE